MIKNEKGITLTALVITIILMFILVGTGVNVSTTSLRDAKYNKWETELGIIRQATLEKYSMAEAVNQTKNTTSPEGENKSEFWIGTPIAPEELLEIAKLSDYSNSDANATTQACLDAFEDYAEQENILYQEDYYYLLEKNDLTQLGIDQSKHKYIVNYKTGEVYNITKQLPDSQLLYLPTTLSSTSSQSTEDTTNFNDWVE